ncbi:unnamed protein product [Spirodela intermedia]|uniref:Uncharacterized protein n=1 Tax=Spirodela intermedia TaxID=51605 RepID=A0A7I8IWA8_SPIIN|nr:unnamed protein product [Spirodela intermedia]CAA6661953.1 unnamed protein product [Spirodela intermedia]
MDHRKENDLFLLLNMNALDPAEKWLDVCSAVWRWDQKMSKTDYSMVFQRARANRKQNKIHIKAASLGNEQELIARAQDELPSRRKKILGYLNCCIKA